jgi:ribonuclease R
MQQFLGDEFEGIISGVSQFGFWVETIEHKCEGLVSVKDLSDYDDFRQDEANYSLVGMRTGKTFRMGDHITIKVVAANLDKRQLDYQWVTEIEGKAKQAGARGSKSAAKKVEVKKGGAKPAAKKGGKK